MKIKIYLQSWSSLITNSSSETFCVISSKNEDTIIMITNYLNSILPYKVRYENLEYIWEDNHNYAIIFSIEYGECAHELGSNMYALIKKVLEDHFPNNSDFIIENGDNYN